MVGEKKAEKQVADDGQHDDDHDRSVDDHRRGDDDHDHAANDVGGQQDQAAIVSVGDDPGRYREQHVGHDARRADDAQDDRVLGLVPDEDEQRDQVEPVADRRDELAEQQRARARLPRTRR